MILNIYREKSLRLSQLLPEGQQRKWSNWKNVARPKKLKQTSCILPKDDDNVKFNGSIKTF